MGRRREILFAAEVGALIVLVVVASAGVGLGVAIVLIVAYELLLA